MTSDILCYSHLRWNFVYQRPQHLLSRFARRHRVLFIEEPEYVPDDDHYVISMDQEQRVWIITPRLCHIGTDVPHEARIRTQLDKALAELQVERHISWYYTPLALGFSSHLDPVLVVYDCMDELSAFRNAPEKLVEMEKELLAKADLVFTGGQSLFEHKKDLHPGVFPFPSSIDRSHFAYSRENLRDPSDQEEIPSPRFGFYGVVDERFDLDLLREVAEQRPGWHFVILGPVVKIDQGTLPIRPNIHYLGQKSYHELPAYLAGWDVAIMPFAHNESTRFISPTKTPEYLAGGKPVISTSIRDVVKPYGESGMVQIADTADAFIAAAEMILAPGYDRDEWLKKVDEYLSGISWDRTWSDMYQIMESVMLEKNSQQAKKQRAYV